MSSWIGYHPLYVDEGSLKALGLDDRQVLAVLYIKKEDSITLSKYKELAPDVSDKTLFRDLRDLVDRDIIRPVGEKKGRRYELK